MARYLQKIKNKLTPVILVLFLFFFWVVFSAQATAMLLLLGMLSSIFIAFISITILQIPSQIFVLSPLRSFKYIGYLIYQMILSSLYVIKNILNFKIKSWDSAVITVDNNFNSDFLTTVFANSVTLTPGSITIKIENNQIFIHILSKELEEGVRDMYNTVAQTFI